MNDFHRDIHGNGAAEYSDTEEGIFGYSALVPFGGKLVVNRHDDGKKRNDRKKNSGNFKKRELIHSFCSKR